MCPTHGRRGCVARYTHFLPTCVSHQSDYSGTYLHVSDTSRRGSLRQDCAPGSVSPTLASVGRLDIRCNYPMRWSQLMRQQIFGRKLPIFMLKLAGLTDRARSASQPLLHTRQVVQPRSCMYKIFFSAMNDVEQQRSTEQLHICCCKSSKTIFGSVLFQ